MSKIVVGLSGGVDSAVAALLLKREGWQVHGVFMQNWEEEDCPSRQDLLDCAAVCDVLGIELEAVNFAAEYRQRVFANFLQEYEAGRTPNPDVLCNSEIKFDCLLEYAKQLGGAYLATGHYAQLREFQGQWQLLKAEDSTKDQSYFLYRLNQEQLSQVKFPIGNMLKREVREIAQAAGLPNYDRKDSTGICFIGERPFREFLQRFLAPKPGEIRTLDGQIIGEHQGVMFYTLGQRQGLGIGGSREGSEPWYVAGKDAEANILYVAQGRHHPALQRSDAMLHQLSWVGAMPKTHWVYNAKVRYRQQDAPCELADLENDQCVVNFATPQWAITPGQSAVIYESHVCLGGGILMETPRSSA